ncbi:MAG: HD domain-containing protein [Lachnospiraceae bacterium]|nr:HD domain-containing protein [Lachnospiraceae bacterium]
MKKKKSYRLLLGLVPVVGGITVNLLGGWIAGQLSVYIFLDTVGTILAALTGGYLPGIIVALATNLIQSFSYNFSVYFAVINGLIAVSTAFFFQKGYLKKAGGILAYTLLLAALGGGIGYVLMLAIYEGEAGPEYIPLRNWFMDHGVPGYRLPSFLAVMATDLADKALTVVIAMVLARFLPERAWTDLRMEGWQQAPLGEQERRAADQVKCRKRSLRGKVVLILVAASLLLTVVAVFISRELFRNYTEEQHINLAEGAALMAAGVIDAQQVDEYISRGESARGYRETEALLYRIRQSSPDIKYVYVYQIREDGCHVVFDLDSEDVAGEEPGNVIPFDESFAPYVQQLINGEPIAPIITNDTYGWLLTAYRPVYDPQGRCVCYAAVDISMRDLRVYENEFIVKMLSLFMLFFLLILSTGLWLARFHLVLPINSMAECAEAFAYGNNEDMEANVERIEQLQIATGDEVENLYHAFCKTMRDSVTYAEDVKQQAQTIGEMQSGLIVILADLVENRDESTGDHIKKTAAYTRIIMEGLRKKGYYADQLTDKFMDDVEKSAPLHDVGKIAVPDAILNKPGKLTDEEFAVMKTHTTAGKQIMEEAIAKVHGESYLTEARNLAAYHHEKWNGKGYPEGLSGEDIPLSARIMAVADVFDALVSKRVYKPAFSFEKAMGIIKEDAGTHFDPLVAEVFIEAIDEVRSVAEHFDSLRREKEEQEGKKED